MLALFLGGGLALAAGGEPYGWARRVDRDALPLVREIQDWQLVFLVVGRPVVARGSAATSSLGRQQGTD